MIDGMEMDVATNPRARSGRPSISIATASRARSGGCRCACSAWTKAGLELAHHLGRALQLTNILRDIDEDAAIGRLYLPREALDRPASPDRSAGRCRARRSQGLHTAGRRAPKKIPLKAEPIMHATRDAGWRPRES